MIKICKIALCDMWQVFPGHITNSIRNSGMNRRESGRVRFCSSVVSDELPKALETSSKETCHITDDDMYYIRPNQP